LPPPPDALGGKSATELIESGKVKVTIDPKFPQAIGIAAIQHRTWMYGNFVWEFLVNPLDDNPLCTSDNPIGIEDTEDVRVLNKVAPLTPNLAVRIRPDITLARREPDPNFGKFRYSIRTLVRHEVIQLNELIVRCAEDAVFFRDDRPWMRILIEKNRDFRIETLVEKKDVGDRLLVMSRQRIVRQAIEERT
jgi:hypothetical protein